MQISFTSNLFHTDSVQTNFDTIDNTNNSDNQENTHETDVSENIAANSFNKAEVESKHNTQNQTENFHTSNQTKTHKPILITRILQAINWKCEVQYCQNDSENHAILIAPYPETGANMNNTIIRLMFDIFARAGWNVLRFNFSHQAKIKGHMQCLVEANYITDWYLKNVMQQKHNFIVCGYSSGAFMSLELLMRRPEINGFIALALSGNINYNTFLAPYTNPGLFVHGKFDQIASLERMQEIYKKMQHQQGNIELKIIDDDHFFTTHKFDLLKQIIKEYITKLAYKEKVDNLNDYYDEDMDNDLEY